MWGCSSGESRNRGRPQVSRTVIVRDQQRAHMAPSGAWTAPGGSRWRPGRLPVASGTLPGMDLGPKFVPKLRVLWFFGPERPQEPPLSVETPGDCADGPKREFGAPKGNLGSGRIFKSERIRRDILSIYAGGTPPKLRKVRTAPKWSVATSGFDKPDFLAQIWHNLFSDS